MLSLGGAPFESNMGHVAKVGVRHLGRDRANVFWGFVWLDGEPFLDVATLGVGVAARVAEDTTGVALTQRLSTRRTRVAAVAHGSSSTACASSSGISSGRRDFVDAVQAVGDGLDEVLHLLALLPIGLTPHLRLRPTETRARQRARHVCQPPCAVCVCCLSFLSPPKPFALVITFLHKSCGDVFYMCARRNSTLSPTTF